MKRRRSSGRRIRGRVSKRTRRYGRRRSFRRRRSSGMVHHFKRMISGNFTTWSTGTVSYVSSKILGNAVHAPWLGSFSVRGVTDLIQSADFVNLFDQYRLNKVVLKFYLKVDPGAQAAASAVIPRLYFYRDYDDNSPPGSLDEIRENQKCRVKVLSLYRPVTLVYKPNCLNTLYSAPAVSNYKPVFKQWLDMATPGTVHYGYKFGIDDLTNTNYRVDVEPTLYFSCRQPR